MARYDPIVLVVIKVRRHVARVRFFRRRFERDEVTAIPFRALHDVHVLKIFRSVFDGCDAIREQRQIGCYKLLPARTFDIDSRKKWVTRGSEPSFSSQEAGSSKSTEIWR